MIIYITQLLAKKILKGLFTGLKGILSFAEFGGGFFALMRELK